MRIEDIHSEYEKDKTIDSTNVIEEGARIPKLFAKYRAMYDREKYLWIKLNNEFKILRKEKYEHYSQGASKETRAKGWEVPQNRILKQDLPIYLEADKELLDLQTKIDISKLKVDTLESYCKEILARNYIVQNIGAMIRFYSGN